MKKLRLTDYIRDIPDFPKPGIVFKDITPLLGNPEAFAQAIDNLVEPFLQMHVTKVVGIEARGFLFAPLLAGKLNAGVVPVRKPGKLPFETERFTYDLEYGTDTIEIHRDAIRPGENVLIVDDLLATGGTVDAARNLVEKLGGRVVGMAFLIELAFLNGRQKLNGYTVHSLIQY
ncbi:adenine phosphoribosyltransferase [bacterium]|nr:adenine phosphoribosyltransferase [candidate division CSSED10-310 bacterium]